MRTLVVIGFVVTRPGFDGPNSAEEGTGTCLILVTPDSERTMFTHLGISSQLHPENVDEPILKDNEEQLARSGIKDRHGPAGTAVLFNMSALHTATVRETQQERKTAQVYYGHRDRQYLSNDSLIPPTFWRDHPDPEVRAFYSILNPRTQVFMKSFGPPEPVS